MDRNLCSLICAPLPAPSQPEVVLMASQSHQLHVFFFPLLAHGHMIPMTDIARLFSLRGLKSTIITTPFFAANISFKIHRYQNSGLDINIQTITFPSEEAGLPKGCESLDSTTSNQMVLKFGNAIKMLQPQFEQLLKDMRPDCIVADMFIPWATDVADKHGIPRIAFHGTSMFARCVTENLKHSYQQQSDSEVLVVPGLPDEVMLKKSQMPKPTDVESNTKFTELMDQINEAERTGYGVLVNSFYELEPAYADHYRQINGIRVWHIGPVSLINTNIIDKAQRGKTGEIDEHYFLNWLNTKESSSVIYISFGSVSHISRAQLIEIAKGLEASAVPFIWVVRRSNINNDDHFLPDGFEERMEGKGLVIRDWAPQVLILDHPAIGGFMTHCGWNSTLEGVTAGVPMITWPMFAEQFHNEILITEVLKIGIKVGANKWNSWVNPINDLVMKESVEKVVSRVMRSEEGGQIRKRARELKALAKRAVDQGGSSHTDLTALIEKLQERSIAENYK